MKIKLVLCSLLFASFVYADMIVNQSALPQNAHKFIETYFKGSRVNLVKQDKNSFDVLLNDGTKLEFYINGEWKEVDGKNKAIPTDFLPAKALASAKAAQPNAQIIEVDKKPYGVKFKFSNQMEVYTDANGNVMGQKFDD